MRKRIKKKIDIKIDAKHVVTVARYNAIVNKEKFFKKVFISILKDNFDDTLIKLVDIKSEYFKRLPSALQADGSLIQILKNLIGSNKDNKTHLVRDPNVDWYYCDATSADFIDVDETQRKPLPLPKELERSKKKKYYAFYASIVNDSLPTTIIEAEQDIVADASVSYDAVDFTTIESKKLDYSEMQRKAQIIGDIGEEYVLKKEIQKLKSLRIKKSPEWVSRKSDRYGFDILSYRKKADGSIENVYIEVKTTNGNLTNPFFVSEKELEVSKTYSDNYKLVRVYNAGDERRIQCEEYVGDLSKNALLEQIGSKSTYEFKVK